MSSNLHTAARESTHGRCRPCTSACRRSRPAWRTRPDRARRSSPRDTGSWCARPATIARQQTAPIGWQFDLRSVATSLPPGEAMMVRGGSQSPSMVPRRKNELSHDRRSERPQPTVASSSEPLVIDGLHLRHVRLVVVVEGVDLAPCAASCPSSPARGSSTVAALCWRSMRSVSNGASPDCTV